MAMDAALLGQFTLSLEVQQVDLNVVLFYNLIETLGKLFLNQLEVFPLLFVSAIAELNRFRTVCILPVFLVVLVVEVDEEERVPELDEAVSGIRFVFLVKWQLRCFVRLKI